MTRNILLFLLGLVGIGFFLRSYLMPNNVFFGPEQGNDFRIIRDIVVSGKHTLIGPKTDVAGVFHGPLFYYLATIPFAATGGDPYLITLFFVAIQSLTVFLIYRLAFEFTQSRRVGVFAALLFSVSFGCISYARWTSGQQLTIPLASLFFVFLLRFFNGHSRSLWGAALVFGLMGQAEFINFLLAATVLAVLFVTRFRDFFRHPVWTLASSVFIGIVASVGNFFLFDLRHEFLISKSLMGLVGGTAGFSVPLAESIRSTMDMLLRSAMDTLGMHDVFITGALLVLIVAAALTRRSERRHMHMLCIWLAAPVLILMLMRHAVLQQLFVFLIPGLLVGAAVLVDATWVRLGKLAGLTFLTVLVISNLWLWYTLLPTNARVFFQASQPELRYGDELAAVAYAYESAGGSPFFFQSYTIPYFWQDGWEYLFWFYGTKHGLALPDKEKDKRLYVIIQKDRSNPAFQKDWYDKTVQGWGTKTREKTFGEITVEERIRK